MKNSVALCTYNGGKYIKEQLESILGQTTPVDEIVVCDDGSTDNTLNIINSFSVTSSVNLRIYRNETQLGPGCNFQKAIDLCTGDIVFLSDQDDIWNSAKVETINSYFESHPNISVVFSNGELITSNGEPMQDTLWNHFFSGEIRNMFDKGLDLEAFAEDNRVTGATIAFRKKYVHLSKDVRYCPGFYHDYVIALTALKTGSLGYIDECLIKYRIHKEQVCSLDVRASKIKHNPDWGYFPQNVVYQFCNTAENYDRLNFLSFRFRTKHKALAPLFILKHLPDYQHHYHRGWKCAMTYDIKRAFNHSFYRILSFISRNVFHSSRED